MATTDNYLIDLGQLIADKARDARQNRDDAKDSDSYEYQVGYLMAYHEVVSLMQQQADAFGVHRQHIGLGELDPDIDLI